MNHYNKFSNFSDSENKFSSASGNIDECGFISASGLSYKNQIGNPNAIDWQQIQADLATYGARKCSDNGPSICKCDCNLDGITDFVIPVPVQAMNWIPNYPLPTSLYHAIIIDFMCCYNACNGECFGDTEGLSGSDGQTPVGGNTGSTGGVGGVVKPRKRRK